MKYHGWYLLVFLVILLSFSPVMTTWAQQSAFWFTSVSWDQDNCPLKVTSTTKHAVKIDQGDTDVEAIENFYSVMYAIPRHTGNKITLKISSQRPIHWGKCKRRMTFPVHKNNKRYMWSILFIKRVPNSKSCQCQPQQRQHLRFEGQGF